MNKLFKKYFLIAILLTIFLSSFLLGEENKSTIQIKKNIIDTFASFTSIEKFVQIFQTNENNNGKDEIDTLIENLQSHNYLLQQLSTCWKNVELTIKDVPHIRHDIIVNRLLFWDILLKLVDQHHDFSTTILINVAPDTSLNPNVIGFFASGMSPNDIKDPIIRKDYEERIKRNKNLLLSRRLQTKLIDIKNIFIIDSYNFFIDGYSKNPRNDGELVKLLKEHNYPEEEKEKIFDTLKIPYIRFREWQSQDGKFKITAKFVSFDGQNVILEDKDKKREIVTFSSLRKEDQKYVKEQVKGEK